MVRSNKKVSLLFPEAVELLLLAFKGVCAPAKICRQHSMLVRYVMVIFNK